MRSNASGDDVRLLALHLDVPVLVVCGLVSNLPERLLNEAVNVPLAWFEEPLDKGDYAGHADLRNRIDIPIALGENYYNETQFEQAMTTARRTLFNRTSVASAGSVGGWRLPRRSGVVIYRWSPTTSSRCTSIWPVCSSTFRTSSAIQRCSIRYWKNHSNLARGPFDRRTSRVTESASEGSIGIGRRGTSRRGV